MITGKLNWDVLKKLLSENRGSIRNEVKKGGAVGEDCAVVYLEDDYLVLSTDPVTAAAENIGKIAFHININDIATTGAKPLGIMVTILAPRGASIEDIEEVMKDISSEAKKMDVMIIGGHTEVTDSVNRMIVSITALGLVDKGEKIIWTSGAKPGDKIIITKALGLEGTSILVNDFEEESRAVLSEEELLEAKNYALELSVLKEGRLMKSLATSMHDITEGGVLGALWEIKEASGKGFKVDEGKLPVRELTERLCNHFGLDPLRLISSGSMAITVTDEKEAMRILKKNHVEAHVIGEITEEGSIMIKNGEVVDVEAPLRDEIYKLYD
ncbi:MAG: AIR synthase family protein [Clostridiaceae bacterium]